MNTRASRLNNRVREINAEINDLTKTRDRLLVEMRLNAATQIALEIDPDGTSGFTKATLLEEMANEIDDAPENLERLIGDAVTNRELEFRGSLMAVTRGTWAKLGH